MSLLDALRAELEPLLAMQLPPEARAATLELTGSQVALRIYLHGPGGLPQWEALDAHFTPLVERRLPAGEGWSVIVQTMRRDRPEPLDVFGAMVWIEDGTEVRTIDGRAAGQGNAHA